MDWHPMLIFKGSTNVQVLVNLRGWWCVEGSATEMRDILASCVSVCVWTTVCASNWSEAVASRVLMSRCQLDPGADLEQSECLSPAVGGIHPVYIFTSGLPFCSAKEGSRIRLLSAFMWAPWAYLWSVWPAMFMCLHSAYVHSVWICLLGTCPKPHHWMVLRRTWIWKADYLVDKKLAGQLHLESCCQQLNVQVELSDEQCLSGVHTGTWTV